MDLSNDPLFPAAARYDDLAALSQCPARFNDLHLRFFNILQPNRIYKIKLFFNKTRGSRESTRQPADARAG